MTVTVTPPQTSPVSPPPDPRRRVDLARLRSAWGIAALVFLAIAVIGQTLGTVVAGRLATNATSNLVWLLALCVAGGAVLDTAGRFTWAAVVDRAEGKLREDLLDAALHQPLSALNEQAVGEVLDRVDDDTHEVGNLARRESWGLMRTLFGLLPMWIVAGITWWPAAILFPLVGGAVFLAIRPLLGQIAEGKVIEEMAWTDHAAALEEGIAGADDLRTSLGQSFAIQRLAGLSAKVHDRFFKVVTIEGRLIRRTGLIAYGFLALTGVIGVALVSSDHLTLGELVTLFLVTTTFVAQIDQTAHHLPDLQAGLGAVIRLRQMLGVAPEPSGGRPVPEGGLSIDVHDLDFSYGAGSFGLRDVNLHVPAGDTIALVGRTGSGKSTLASLLSRAVEAPPGTVLLGGVDIVDLDLQQLRSRVGVVTQRTEILAGTLAENITLFTELPRATVQEAVDRLGLTDWVAGLSDGLDTLLGPGGTALSAGEEQLVAFARLLVRNVQVVVLDEATARMDPVTEARVVAAADRLIAGRTGVLIAHRLGTIERARLVAVLDGGRIVQQGVRAELAVQPGPLRDLVLASAAVDAPAPEDTAAAGGLVATRRTTQPPPAPEIGTGPSLAKGIAHALIVRPEWGLIAIGMFLVSAICGGLGAGTGWIWGTIVQDLQGGQTPSWLLVALVGCLLIGVLTLVSAIKRYPRWWIEILLRVRMSVLVGQTQQHRLPKTPAGEVVARAMDADRYARYADRWVDFVNGLAIALVTALFAGTWVAGAVLLIVMLSSALASALGRPVAGRSASRASAARASFGRALVSALDSARTIKLAGRIPQIHRHLRTVDGGRVEAAVFEHRVQALLDGVPILMVQLGVVAAWAAYLAGWWGLATAILVANAVNGFDWFGRVAGSVVTEAPGTRAWQKATSRFAGGVDLMDLPPGVDLLTGDAPGAPEVARIELRQLTLRDVTALHDDGTIGVTGVNLTVERGELVLLLGQVGSGKSSLLKSLAGLLPHTGSIRWNGVEVEDAELFLRPGQVAYVGQIPRVLSGTFDDNVRLGFDRDFVQPADDARLSRDVADAGGASALVGHRGVRLSGGQVQRLALARALAADAELLLADDVSSALDAATEIELWTALRSRNMTVIGSTSKRSALERADRVVVLVDGRLADVGAWSDLAVRWGHLAG